MGGGEALSARGAWLVIETGMISSGTASPVTNIISVCLSFLVTTLVYFTSGSMTQPAHYLTRFINYLVSLINVIRAFKISTLGLVDNSLGYFYARVMFVISRHVIRHRVQPLSLYFLISVVESSIGAGIDSYYEYLLKAYILLGDEVYLQR